MAELTIKEKREKRQALIARANGRFDAAGDKPLSEEEWASFQAERKELDDLGTEIAAADLRDREEKAARDQIRELSAGMGVEQKRVEDTVAKRGGTLGQMFAESPELKRFLAQFPNGQMPESYKGFHMPPVSIGMSPDRIKALLTGATLLTGDSSTSGGAFVVNDVQEGLYVPLARRTLSILDLINVVGTDSDTVEYVRQTARATAAAAVAEATTTSNGEKPESALAFEKVTATVVTIAHWVPATKRALSDVSQLRAIIDSELRYGLNRAVEDDVLNGNGAPAFTGIFNTANLQTQTFSTDLFTTTRKAVTKMQIIAMEEPTGWLFTPTDWETFELLKDAEDRYYFGGPFATGPRTVWGYPPAINAGLLAGHAFLGNFRRAYLWMREGISITATDSHADFFIRNLIAVLAELRAAFGVTKPSAFVKISLNAAS